MSYLFTQEAAGDPDLPPDAEPPEDWPADADPSPPSFRRSPLPPRTKPPPDTPLSSWTPDQEHPILGPAPAPSNYSIPRNPSQGPPYYPDWVDEERGRIMRLEALHPQPHLLRNDQPGNPEWQAAFRDFVRGTMDEEHYSNVRELLDKAFREWHKPVAERDPVTNMFHDAWLKQMPGYSLARLDRTRTALTPHGQGAPDIAGLIDRTWGAYAPYQRELPEYEREDPHMTYGGAFGAVVTPNGTTMMGGDSLPETFAYAFREAGIPWPLEWQSENNPLDIPGISPRAWLYDVLSNSGMISIDFEDPNDPVVRVPSADYSLTDAQAQAVLRAAELTGVPTDWIKWQLGDDTDLPPEPQTAFFLRLNELNPDSGPEAPSVPRGASSPSSAGSIPPADLDRLIETAPDELLHAQIEIFKRYPDKVWSANGGVLVASGGAVFSGIPDLKATVEDMVEGEGRPVPPEWADMTEMEWRLNILQGTGLANVIASKGIAIDEPGYGMVELGSPDAVISEPQWHMIVAAARATGVPPKEWHFLAPARNELADYFGYAPMPMADQFRAELSERIAKQQGGTEADEEPEPAGGGGDEPDVSRPTDRWDAADTRPQVDRSYAGAVQPLPDNPGVYPAPHAGDVPSHPSDPDPTDYFTKRRAADLPRGKERNTAYAFRNFRLDPNGVDTDHHEDAHLWEQAIREGAEHVDDDDKAGYYHLLLSDGTRVGAAGTYEELEQQIVEALDGGGAMASQFGWDISDIEIMNEVAREGFEEDYPELSEALSAGPDHPDYDEAEELYEEYESATRSEPSEQDVSRYYDLAGRHWHSDSEVSAEELAETGDLYLLDSMLRQSNMGLITPDTFEWRGGDHKPTHEQVDGLARYAHATVSRKDDLFDMIVDGQPDLSKILSASARRPKGRRRGAMDESTDKHRAWLEGPGDIHAEDAPPYSEGIDFYHDMLAHVIDTRRRAMVRQGLLAPHPELDYAEEADYSADDEPEDPDYTPPRMRDIPSGIKKRPPRDWTEDKDPPPAAREPTWEENLAKAAAKNPFPKYTDDEFRDAFKGVFADDADEPDRPDGPDRAGAHPTSPVSELPAGEPIEPPEDWTADKDPPLPPGSAPGLPAQAPPGAAAAAHPAAAELEHAINLAHADRDTRQQTEDRIADDPSFAWAGTGGTLVTRAGSPLVGGDWLMEMSSDTMESAGMQYPEEWNDLYLREWLPQVLPGTGMLALYAESAQVQGGNAFVTLGSAGQVPSEEQWAVIVRAARDTGMTDAGAWGWHVADPAAEKELDRPDLAEELARRLAAAGTEAYHWWPYAREEERDTTLDEYTIGAPAEAPSPPPPSYTPPPVAGGDIPEGDPVEPPEDWTADLDPAPPRGRYAHNAVDAADDSAARGAPEPPPPPEPEPDDEVRPDPASVPNEYYAEREEWRDSRRRREDPSKRPAHHWSDAEKKGVADAIAAGSARASAAGPGTQGERVAYDPQFAAAITRLMSQAGHYPDRLASHIVLPNGHQATVNNPLDGVAMAMDHHGMPSHQALAGMFPADIINASGAMWVDAPHPFYRNDPNSFQVIIPSSVDPSAAQLEGLAYMMLHNAVTDDEMGRAIYLLPSARTPDDDSLREMYGRYHRLLREAAERLIQEGKGPSNFNPARRLQQERPWEPWLADEDEQYEYEQRYVPFSDWRRGHGFEARMGPAVEAEDDDDEDERAILNDIAARIPVYLISDEYGREAEEEDEYDDDANIPMDQYGGYTYKQFHENNHDAISNLDLKAYERAAKKAAKAQQEWRQGKSGISPLITPAGHVVDTGTHTQAMLDLLDDAGSEYEWDPEGHDYEHVDHFLRSTNTIRFANDRLHMNIPRLGIQHHGAHKITGAQRRAIEDYLWAHRDRFNEIILDPPDPLLQRRLDNLLAQVRGEEGYGDYGEDNIDDDEPSAIAQLDPQMGSYFQQRRNKLAGGGVAPGPEPGDAAGLIGLGVPPRLARWSAKAEPKPPSEPTPREPFGRTDYRMAWTPTSRGSRRARYGYPDEKPPADWWRMNRRQIGGRFKAFQQRNEPEPRYEPEQEQPHWLELDPDDLRDRIARTGHGASYPGGSLGPELATMVMPDGAAYHGEAHDELVRRMIELAGARYDEDDQPGYEGAQIDMQFLDRLGPIRAAWAPLPDDPLGPQELHLDTRHADGRNYTIPTLAQLQTVRDQLGSLPESDQPSRIDVEYMGFEPGSENYQALVEWLYGRADELPPGIARDADDVSGGAEPEPDLVDPEPEEIAAFGYYDDDMLNAEKRILAAAPPSLDRAEPGGAYLLLSDGNLQQGDAHPNIADDLLDAAGYSPLPDPDLMEEVGHTPLTMWLNDTNTVRLVWANATLYVELPKDSASMNRAQADRIRNSVLALPPEHRPNLTEFDVGNRTEKNPELAAYLLGAPINPDDVSFALDNPPSWAEQEQEQEQPQQQEQPQEGADVDMDAVQKAAAASLETTTDYFDQGAGPAVVMLPDGAAYALGPTHEDTAAVLLGNAGWGAPADIPRGDLLERLLAAGAIRLADDGNDAYLDLARMPTDEQLENLALGLAESGLTPILDSPLSIGDEQAILARLRPAEEPESDDDDDDLEAEWLASEHPRWSEYADLAQLVQTHVPADWQSDNTADQNHAHIIFPDGTSYAADSHGEVAMMLLMNAGLVDDDNEYQEGWGDVFLASTGGLRVSSFSEKDGNHMNLDNVGGGLPTPEQLARLRADIAQLPEEERPAHFDWGNFGVLPGGEGKVLEDYLLGRSDVPPGAEAPAEEEPGPSLDMDVVQRAAAASLKPITDYFGEDAFGGVMMLPNGVAYAPGDSHEETSAILLDTAKDPSLQEGQPITDALERMLAAGAIRLASDGEEGMIHAERMPTDEQLDNLALGFAESRLTPLIYGSLSPADEQAILARLRPAEEPGPEEPEADPDDEADTDYLAEDLGLPKGRQAAAGVLEDIVRANPPSEEPLFAAPKGENATLLFPDGTYYHGGGGLHAILATDLLSETGYLHGGEDPGTALLWLQNQGVIRIAHDDADSPAIEVALPPTPDQLEAIADGFGELRRQNPDVESIIWDSEYARQNPDEFNNALIEAGLDPIPSPWEAIRPKVSRSPSPAPPPKARTYRDPFEQTDQPEQPKVDMDRVQQFAANTLDPLAPDDIFRDASDAVIILPDGSAYDPAVSHAQSAKILLSAVMDAPTGDDLELLLENGAIRVYPETGTDEDGAGILDVRVMPTDAQLRTIRAGLVAAGDLKPVLDTTLPTQDDQKILNRLATIEDEEPEPDDDLDADDEYDNFGSPIEVLIPYARDQPQDFMHDVEEAADANLGADLMENPLTDAYGVIMLSNGKAYGGGEHMTIADALVEAAGLDSPEERGPDEDPDRLESLLHAGGIRIIPDAGRRILMLDMRRPPTEQQITALRDAIADADVEDEETGEYRVEPWEIQFEVLGEFPDELKAEITRRLDPTATEAEVDDDPGEHHVWHDTSYDDPGDEPPTPPAAGAPPPSLRDLYTGGGPPRRFWQEFGAHLGHDEEDVESDVLGDVSFARSRTNPDDVEVWYTLRPPERIDPDDPEGRTLDTWRNELDADVEEPEIFPRTHPLFRGFVWHDEEVPPAPPRPPPEPRPPSQDGVYLAGRPDLPPSFWSGLAEVVGVPPGESLNSVIFDRRGDLLHVQYQLESARGREPFKAIDLPLDHPVFRDVRWANYGRSQEADFKSRDPFDDDDDFEDGSPPPPPAPSAPPQGSPTFTADQQHQFPWLVNPPHPVVSQGRHASYEHPHRTFATPSHLHDDIIHQREFGPHYESPRFNLPSLYQAAGGAPRPGADFADDPLHVRQWSTDWWNKFRKATGDTGIQEGDETTWPWNQEPYNIPGAYYADSDDLAITDQYAARHGLDARNTQAHHALNEQWIELNYETHRQRAAAKVLEHDATNALAALPPDELEYLFAEVYPGKPLPVRATVPETIAETLLAGVSGTGLDDQEAADATDALAGVTLPFGGGREESLGSLLDELGYNANRFNERAWESAPAVYCGMPAFRLWQMARTGRHLPPPDRGFLCLTSSPAVAASFALSNGPFGMVVEYDKAAADRHTVRQEYSALPQVADETSADEQLEGTPISYKFAHELQYNLPGGIPIREVPVTGIRVYADMAPLADYHYKAQEVGRMLGIPSERITADQNPEAVRFNPRSDPRYRAYRSPTLPGWLHAHLLAHPKFHAQESYRLPPLPPHMAQELAAREFSEDELRRTYSYGVVRDRPRIPDQEKLRRIAVRFARHLAGRFVPFERGFRLEYAGALLAVRERGGR